MNSPLHDHLAFLYGESGHALAERVLARIDSWRVRLAVERPADLLAPRRPLSARDALLIAYPDQIREPGRSPLAALARFAARRLEGCLSGIHLLPVHPWSSDDGFSVVDFAEVDPACGTWDDIRDLGRRFDLMLDAVLNHVSVRSRWFRGFLADDPEFRDFFVTVAGDPDLSAVVRPRALPLLTPFDTPRGPRRVWTTFSADQADLNYRQPEVLLAMLEVLFRFVAHGARFLRLDAIAFLWKEPGTSCLHLPQTHRVVQLLRTVLDLLAPDVRLVTETNVPHADNIAYWGDGRNEAQLVYNFALPPLVLHALQTGDPSPLASWADGLRPPSDQATFLNFLASHDGIGVNPARGLLPGPALDALIGETRNRGGYVSEKHLPDGSRAPYEMNINYLDALTSPEDAGDPRNSVARFLTAHAIMLGFQGVPALYFHSLVGSRGDRPAAEASGIPRRINRQRLDRLPLEAELDDPRSPRSPIWSGLRRLLAFRRRHDAFSPTATQHVVDLAPGVFAFVRGHDHDRDRDTARQPVLCVHNVSSRTVAVDLPPDLRPAGPALRPGDAAPSAEPGQSLTLPPWDSAWIPLRPAADPHPG
jgi:glycosidase